MKAIVACGGCREHQDLQAPCSAQQAAPSQQLVSRPASPSLCQLTFPPSLLGRLLHRHSTDTCSDANRTPVGRGLGQWQGQVSGTVTGRLGRDSRGHLGLVVHPQEGKQEPFKAPPELAAVAKGHLLQQTTGPQGEVRHRGDKGLCTTLGRDGAAPTCAQATRCPSELASRKGESQREALPGGQASPGRWGRSSRKLSSEVSTQWSPSTALLSTQVSSLAKDANKNQVKRRSFNPWDLLCHQAHLSHLCLEYPVDKQHRILPPSC
ncbi:Inositol hexakisphosphate kinase 3 [Fukomys damarensis]|uniref:Inositol hexakisphosphate kinase 3 n=1 Tax=Fukomys damarensis TaxID=885580 RepID=A0A091DK19_FUKDA|nr:Inositol hexakisphosphate kinase 3 [Fukomys damarensis]